MKDDGAIPVRANTHQPLDGSEVLEMMKHAETKYAQRISTAPPVKPRGGTVFFYNLGADKFKWDLMKRKIR